jgi:hypothetical protein
MSNSITDFLAAILSAKYGEQVRGAIHDAIELCYQDGKAGVNDLEARHLIEQVIGVNEMQDAGIETLTARVEALEQGGEGESAGTTTTTVPTFIVDHGIANFSNVQANKTATMNVTFAKTFTEAPVVAAIKVFRNGPNTFYSLVTAQPVESSITTNGFTLAVGNRYTQAVSPSVLWIAFQPTEIEINTEIIIPSGDGMTEAEVRELLAPISAALNGIKTGYDGTVYDTPGEAVREQINDLHVLIGDTPGTAIQASAVAYGNSDVGTELTNVNGRLDDLTNAITVDLTNTLVIGYIDVGNVAIGGTVDPTVRSGASYKTKAIPCKQGDCFYVNGNGYSGNAPKIWAFTDTNYILISKAENRETLTNAYLVAPSDGYAIFTFLVSAGDYSVKIIKPKTDMTLTEQDVPADSYVTGKEINALKNAKQTVSFAYSGNFDWSITNGKCYLTVNDVTRIRFDTTNAAVDISKATFIAVASASTLVTVSGDTISGTHFAVVFDFNTNTLKILDTAIRATYINTSILFFYHYGNIGGQLVYNKTALDTYKNASDIVDIKSKIGNELPSYFEAEAVTCRDELIADCGEKTFVIAFTTDNHYGASNGMNFPTTVKTIERVNELYPIDIVIDGGDLINGDETKANATNRMCSAVSMLCGIKGNAYTILGNHDDNSFTASELPLFSKAELYAMMCRHEGINLDYIAESEQYGYKDFEQYGLRIIFLDAMQGINGHDNADWGYSDAELAWFASDALDTTKQVVIFSHMGFTKEYSAYNYQVKNGAEMRQAVETFISNGGVVVALFHGHTHWDFIGQYSQTNGFKEVSTGCGRVQSGYPSGTYMPEGATAQTREMNTLSQELWDIIVIKPESRTVDMIRYGAGNDRSFTY